MSVPEYGPHAAGLTGGGFVVVWHSRDQDGTLFSIFGQLFDATGAPVGGEFKVNTDEPGPVGSNKRQLYPAVDGRLDPEANVYHLTAILGGEPVRLAVAPADRATIRQLLEFAGRPHIAAAGTPAAHLACGPERQPGPEGFRIESGKSRRGLRRRLGTA